MKVIRHGRLHEVKTAECTSCGCVIEVEEKELTSISLEDKLKYKALGYVKCPECYTAIFIK